MFLERKIGVLMVFLGLMILGILQMRHLPISLLPDIQVPELKVQITYPNIDGETIENTVVQPIRNQLLQIEGLKNIESKTQNGGAILTLFFDFNTNTDWAFLEANEKIDQIITRLPRNLPRPLVLKISPTNIPVLQMTVTPKEEGQLLAVSEFCQTVLKRRIEQLPEVAFADLTGLVQSEIIITPKPAASEQLGMTTSDFEQILQQQNLDFGTFRLKEGIYEYNVRLKTRLTSVDDLGALYFNRAGQVFQLKDVADLKEQEQSPDGLFLHNGKRSIGIGIYKKSAAQLFDLQSNIYRLKNDFTTDYSELSFNFTNDQSEILTVSIENLQSSLAYGSLAAMSILILFFRRWQAPFLIGLTIPIALIISLLGFYVLKISINIISLSGLILGVGLMIDNTIIVLENIRQKQSEGLPTLEACRTGVNEVIRPLISSALTTCAVFLPLLFLSGIAGALFYDQAISITLALGASLAVAYFLLPVLVLLLPQPKGEVVVKERRWLKKTVDWTLRNRWEVIALIFGGFVGLYALSRHLPLAIFPNLPQKGVSLTVDWNEAIRLEKNQARIQELLADFQTVIAESDVFIGREDFLLQAEKQNYNEAKLDLFFEGVTPKMYEDLRLYFEKNYPAAAVKITPIKTLFDEIFTQKEAAFSLHLQTNEKGKSVDIKTFQPIIDFLQQEKISFRSPTLERQIELEILPETLLLYGIELEEVRREILLILNQYAVGYIASGKENTVIKLGREAGDFYESFHQATIKTPSGVNLPLRRFIKVQSVETPKLITADKAGIYFGIDFFEVEALNTVQERLKSADQLTGKIEGKVVENQKVIQELVYILGVAFLLLYYILAAQFESLAQPFLVLLLIPLGGAGSLLLLALAGESINLLSMIGLVVMSGILVNDAILKIDRINQLKKEYPLEKALHLAGNQRFRPIVMTSLTTILALVPILFSEGLGAALQRPLAFAIIGGLTVGTVVSLVILPVLYKLSSIFKSDHF